MAKDDTSDDSEIEGAGLPKAGDEPTDAELLQLIGGGAAPAKVKKQAKADEELDESGDDDETDDDLGGDEDGEPAAKKKQAADAGDDDEAGDQGEGEGDQGKKGDGSEDDDAADDAAGDDDPEAALDDEDKKVRAKFTPEQQAKFDRAVSKKTRRILELKTELREEQTAREAAETRAAEVEKGAGAAALAPTADNPLADLDDEPALDKRLGEARKLRRFALANPDGAFVDPKSGQVVEVDDPENPPAGVVRFSKKRIGEILAETEETLQEHGPKQRKFLQERATAEAAAVRDFPWLKNKGSLGAVSVETTLRHAPVLRTVPGIKHLLAYAFIGRAVVQNQKQQQAKGGAKDGAAPVKKAPPSPGGSARAPKVDAKQKVAGGAFKTLAATGDDPGDAALRALIR